MTADQYADHSTVAGLASAAAARLRAWVAASRLVRAITALSRAFDDATRTSKLTATLRTLARYVRTSYCYRWLTKEPDPDVIVVDLRETRTVGPFVALLDRIAPSAAAAWRASTLRRLADRLEPTRETVARSRTVRLLAAALEPPALPEETRDGPSAKDDRQEN